MLQKRINELESGILTLDENKVHVMGFKNERMLMSFLNNDKKNWSSIGLYELQAMNFHSIKNNALFIVLRNGKEVEKYQYIPVLKGTVKYNNSDRKNNSMTYTIRKSTYSDHYHLLSEKVSRVFDSKQEIISYFQEEFGERINF